ERKRVFRFALRAQEVCKIAARDDRLWIEFERAFVFARRFIHAQRESVSRAERLMRRRQVGRKRARTFGESRRLVHLFDVQVKGRQHEQALRIVFNLRLDQARDLKGRRLLLTQKQIRRKLRHDTDEQLVRHVRWRKRHRLFEFINAARHIARLQLLIRQRRMRAHEMLKRPRLQSSWWILLKQCLQTQDALGRWQRQHRFKLGLRRRLLTCARRPLALRRRRLRFARRLRFIRRRCCARARGWLRYLRVGARARVCGLRLFSRRLWLLCRRLLRGRLFLRRLVRLRPTTQNKNAAEDNEQTQR